MAWLAFCLFFQHSCGGTSEHNLAIRRKRRNRKRSKKRVDAMHAASSPTLCHRFSRCSTFYRLLALASQSTFQLVRFFYPPPPDQTQQSSRCSWSERAMKKNRFSIFSIPVWSSSWIFPRNSPLFFLFPPPHPRSCAKISTFSSAWSFSPSK